MMEWVALSAGRCGSEYVEYSQITEDGELAVLSSSNQYSVSDKVIRGGVIIQKRDLDEYSAI